MSRFLTLAVLTLALGHPVSAQQAPTAQLELTSCYLVESLSLPDGGRAHSIVLHVDLEKRKGRISLDPNSCMLSPFGDMQVCTEMAPRTFEVTLKQAKLADPRNEGRRLFLLDGVPGKVKLHLVVPREGEPGHRLVVSDAEGETRAIVPLQRVVRERAGK